MSDESIEKCAFCGVSSSLKCQGCKSVAYCSKEHQKTHWKVHKNECRPFKISDDLDFGRYVEATRDIPAKSVIFMEPPLIVGPSWTYDESMQMTFFCVGCFEPIKVFNYKCPKCYWPACCPACIGLASPLLHDIECAVLSIGKGPANRTDIKSVRDYYRTDSLFALKCLLLQSRFPKKWKQLLELQNHEKERKKTFNYENIRCREAEKRINYLDENYLKLLVKVEEKTGKTLLAEKDKKILHKIYGIIETNAMYLTTNNDIAGLYAIGCMIEHSCVPNSHFVFDKKDGFKLIVKAARDIKKGEHISTMYSHVLWGTQLRQQHLKDAKYFKCQCERCSDPTELGTHLSSLRCIGTEESPCNGIQTPENPLSDAPEWACNKCPVKVTMEQVMFLTEKMGEQIDNLLFNNPTLKSIEDLLEKLAPFLHPNHYHMFGLKHSLIQLCDEGSSDELLERKLKICNELLEVVQKLDPYSIRIPVYTGIVLYEKHLTSLELKRRNKIEYDAKDGDVSLKQAKEILVDELDTIQAQELDSKISIAMDKLKI